MSGHRSVANLNVEGDATGHAAPVRHTRAPLAAIAGAQEWWIRSMQSLLEPHGFAVLRLHSARQVLDQMEVAAPDLIVIHSELADTSGIALCQTLKERRLLDPTTPVLLLTSVHCDRERRLQALRAGAWECLAYPYDAEELLARIDRYVRARIAADHQREVSLIEPETGLYSVSGIVRRARELGMYAIRHRRPLGCAAFGLAPEPLGEVAPSDGGAPAFPSPEIVGSFARTLTAVARASDIVGRLSRTEFVVLAPETDEAGVVGLARRVIEQVRPTLRLDGAPDSGGLVRAGCFAVSDGSQGLLEPVEVVARATVALRQAYLESSDVPVILPA